MSKHVLVKEQAICETTFFVEAIDETTRSAYRAQLLEAGVASSGNEEQLCLSSHYAAIVEAHKDAEIYQHGDVECPSCLRCMADKHQAIADVFRARLAAIGVAP